jgi:hypothetical protein
MGVDVMQGIKGGMGVLAGTTICARHKEGKDMLPQGRRIVTESAGVCGLGGNAIVLQD